MSNQVVLEQTHTKTLYDGNIVNGYLFYDDYNNIIGELNGGYVEETPLSNLRLLEEVMNPRNYSHSQDEKNDLIQFVIDCKHGITINGDYYSFEQLENTLENYPDIIEELNDLEDEESTKGWLEHLDKKEKEKNEENHLG